MNIRAALTAALVVPSAVALTGPVTPTYAAASVCQGQPATIESAESSVAGTEGNDVIVATHPHAAIDGLGGNDLVCLVGGYVSTGAGDDSVVSSAPAGASVEAGLSGGNDSYTSTGPGTSRVFAWELSGLHIDLGPGGGDVWLWSTSTPGTGSIDLGPHGGTLNIEDVQSAHIDLAHGTASVDNLLNVTIANVRDVSGRGHEVRLVGDDNNNELDAAGCDIVVSGGDGRDELSIVSYDTDRLADRGRPPCPARDYRSVLKGQGGPDRLNGRRYDEVLLGGPGRDVAAGSGGNDRCVAEVERHCER
jgi:Ca2+-binding RTX toxin-like protein